jgi:tight adherence protein B
MWPRLVALAAVWARGARGASTALGAPTPGTPKLLPTNVSKFPNRSYVLSLPRTAQVNTEGVQVVENGQPVNGLQIDLPGQTGSASVGIVLVIDASLSMRGEPIKQAMAAARAFASNRGAQEQVGTILFNSATKTVLPLSTSDAQIAAALSKRPALSFGTHIDDALQAALKLLQASHIDIGSIVLLSDGHDVGSLVNENDVLGAAKSARVRIFSVGLRSASFTPGTLSRLSRSTGGTFTVASTAASLSSIYSALSVAISSEYLITYRSLAGPAQSVFVSVKVPGFRGAAVAAYKSPGLPASSVAHRSWFTKFIQSTLAAIIVVVVVVLLVGFAIFVIFRRRDRGFERRMARFVTLSPDEQAALRKEDITEALEQQPAERPLLEPARLYEEFEEEIELGGLEMTPRSIVGLTIAATALVAAVFAGLIGSVWGVLFGLVVPVLVRWFVRFKLRRVRTEFAEQLPDNLDVVSSALRAGHSLVGALKVTVDASSEPSKSELGRALADEQLGVPLDEALRVVAKRMDNRDLLQVALVSMLQREAGTNAAEVLEQVAENVRGQMDLKRLVRTLTAQGRMARWIVSFLPLGLFLALFLLNRHYLRPLWETNGGIAAMVVAGLMVIAGSLLIKKIVEIEV